LPLGSWLKTDPWDDRVHQLNAKIYPYMNPRDKMPLEVTPIFFKLQRYDASKLTPPAAPATVPPATPPAAGDTTQQPAGTSPPPATTPAAVPPATPPAAGDTTQQPAGTTPPAVQ
jgi:hypothetical protein